MAIKTTIKKQKTKKKLKKNKLTEEVRHLLISVVIISLIVGAISGSVGGFIIGFYGLKYGSYECGGSGIGVDGDIARGNEELATISTVKNVSPSVVSIIISKDLSKHYNATGSDIFPFDDYFEFGFPDSQEVDLNGMQEVGVGTGFIVDSGDGLILTNKHVVSDPDAKFSVITSDGKRYESVEVLAQDTINDLAIIKIGGVDLPSIRFGDSDDIRIGETVIAIGFTLGEYANTVTKGIVSGIGRNISAMGISHVRNLEDVIQTDAAINPGNSGGPLINLSGEIIGVNTALSQNGQLIGFAIPSNEAKFVFESVKKHGKIERAFLGVRYIPINKKIAKINNLSIDYGALIIGGSVVEEFAVVPGSPADKAGLAENDIILEVDGQKIDEKHSLVRAIGINRPGDVVELRVLHDGNEKVLKVVLGRRGQ